MRALIIDDEIDICYLLSTLLDRKSIKSDYVNSIAQAVTALKTSKPEIIFLDNHLPDGRGVDFIHFIKEHNPQVKLVMITAYDTPADRSAAFSKGVDYFVAKPFSRDIIYATLDEMER